MKKIIMLVVSVLVTITSFAQTDDVNRIRIHQNDGKVVVYACSKIDSIDFVKMNRIAADVSVKEFSEAGVTLTVGMPEGCSQCDFAYIEKSLDKSNDDVFGYVRANKAAEIKSSGDVTIEGLNPDNDYIIYTVSRDVYGIETSFVKTELEKSNVNSDFVCEITELTSGHVCIDVIPSDKNMTYTYAMLPKKMYGEAVEMYGDIFSYDINWCEFLAQNYGFSSWKEAMRKLQVKGDISYNSVNEYGALDWDTDYVFYCYGINYDCEVTTPLCIKEFKSPKPVPSDNIIDVEILEVFKDGCKVRVTTTNDDEYVVTAQKQSFVDYWNENGTEKEMLSTLYNDLQINTIFCNLKHNGSGEFEVKTRDADTDYVLIVFGTNDGPTTDVQYIKFHTTAE